MFFFLTAETAPSTSATEKHSAGSNTLASQVIQYQSLVQLRLSYNLLEVHRNIKTIFLCKFMGLILLDDRKTL